MGEVYKARDIRLDRFVALKVLPAEVASDRERLRRFEKEARAASALNHPNILVVHDVGSEGPISYIVTELIDGKTLRDLLLPGPLPIKKLLDLAVQIAEGLASAHEAGIVHRDLKPGNIMLSRDGFAKILDFGLAKVPAAVGGHASVADTEASTETASDTRTGAVIGTVSYMSPEQARGGPLDAGSDQFSFGSILYEMATGRRAFRRETEIDTLSAILHEEPEPIVEQRPDLPPPLIWIIERCLSKYPLDRFLATRDLVLDLAALRDHLSNVSGAKGLPGQSQLKNYSGWRRSLWLLLPITIVIALAVFASLTRHEPARVVHLSLPPPPNSAFNFSTSAPAPAALSPDGTGIVFGIKESSGRSLLWFRRLAEPEIHPLPETEGATYPFWSPDGSSVGFFADGKLKRINVATGVVETLCEASDGRGASWSRAGLILFAPDSIGPLYAVSEKGGEQRTITGEKAPRADFSHRWPSFLPDGRHFLYLVRGSKGLPGGVYLGSLDSGSRTLLIRDLTNAVFAPPGFLLFVRNGSLMTAPFDLRRLATSGQPTLLVERVNYQPYRWNGAFTVSEKGQLAYETSAGATKAQLNRFDRSGRNLGSVAAPADYGGFRLSPDEKRCAIEIHDPATGVIGVWVLELERGVATRLSPAGTMSVSPAWSPDGKRIAFTSSLKGRWNLFLRDASSARPEEPLLVSEEAKSPSDWSPDGSLIAFNSTGLGADDKDSVWLFRVAERRPVPLLRSSFNQRDARFSPDGRMIAYASDETGAREVYVRRFPSTDQKWRISPDGGSQPSWRSDGKELFYLAPDNRVMAVPVDGSLPLGFGVSTPLFEAPIRMSATDIGLFSAVSQGQQFLVVTAPKNASSTALNVILNWAAGLPQ